MTEQDIARLMYQMETDPFARSANDYGQGPEFLMYGSEPDSWRRTGDKYDLLQDFLRTTKTYFPDYVPNLYEEVQRPEPYVSDTAGLYRNNPAYQHVLGAVAEGMSLDEAVNAAAAVPEYAAMLPQGEAGGPNVQAFRTGAETFLGEVAREDRYAQDLARYEDFVRPQSDWDLNPYAEGGPEQFYRRIVSNRVTPGQPRPGASWTSTLSQSNNSPAPSNSSGGVSPRQRRGERNTQTGNAAAGRDEEHGKASPVNPMAANNVAIYNDMVRRVFEFEKNKQSQKMNSSKQDQNRAAVARALNAYIYGQNR